MLRGSAEPGVVRRRPRILSVPWIPCELVQCDPICFVTIETILEELFGFWGKSIIPRRSKIWNPKDHEGSLFHVIFAKLFQNVSNWFNLFQKFYCFSKRFKRFQNLPECFKLFLTNPKCFKVFQHGVLICSRTNDALCDMFNNTLCCCLGLLVRR